MWLMQKQYQRKHIGTGIITGYRFMFSQMIAFESGFFNHSHRFLHVHGDVQHSVELRDRD